MIIYLKNSFFFQLFFENANIQGHKLRHIRQRAVGTLEAAQIFCCIYVLLRASFLSYEKELVCFIVISLLRFSSHLVFFVRLAAFLFSLHQATA